MTGYTYFLTHAKLRFFVKAHHTPLGGEGGPPVLDEPTRHCPRRGSGWLDHILPINIVAISS